MVPPPFLVGGAILFWGWATGFVWVAALMAAIIEFPRLFRLRWDFSEDDFERLWTLCCIIFLGVLAVRSFMGDAPGPGARDVPGSTNALSEPTTVYLALAQWIPLIFFPIAAAQAYSSRLSIRLTAFFWMFRKRLEKSWFQPSINVGFPYVAVCALSASAANNRTIWFFAGLAAITAGGLWVLRPKRYPVVLWILMMMLALKASFWAHEGMLALHSYLEGKTNELLARFSDRNVNPVESRTSIGRIGKVKLSGEIVLRVEPMGKPPALLREAVYNKYNGGIWTANRGDFLDASPEADLESWRLQPPQVGTEGVYISQYLDGGRGLLAVPTGVSELLSLPVGTLSTNRLGAIRARQGPGLVRFRAHYTDRRTFEVGPVPVDLDLPEGSERTALKKTVEELGLEVGTDPAMAVRVLEQFFGRNFSYTTFLQIPDYNSKNDEFPLSRFLLKERTGHCEYFATATALLLRQLGIPTRYATGFAVDELAKDAKTYIVRQRHAHAWVLVWIDGAWHNVDTTPGGWFNEEDKLKSFWEPFNDWIASLKYTFAKFRWLKEERSWQNLLPYILVPMLLYVGWRVSRGLGRSRQRQLEAAAARRNWPGEDSEYFKLEAVLSEQGLDRAENETIADWRNRLRSSLGDNLENSLILLRRLHLRLRFDPAGLSADERAQLREGSVQLADFFLKKVATKTPQLSAGR